MKLIGVGPGDPELITVKGRMSIETCQVIVGWASVIERFSDLTQGKEIITLTYRKEHEGLSIASRREEEGKEVCILDHGDPGVSDWQFVEKVKSYFKKVEVIPGVSVVNAALDQLGEDLGKNCFVTLHVRGDIKPFMDDILSCLKMGRGVLVNPEPYDDGPQRVAKFLKDKGIEGKVIVMERLTYSDSSMHEFSVSELSTSNRKFSDLSILHVRSK